MFKAAQGAEVASISQHFKSAHDARGDILFYGDPHGNWAPLFTAVEHKNPEAVVILGDLAEPKRDPDSVRTARVALERLLEAGIDVRMISGNHDTDTPELYDLVFGEFGKLLINGRVVELGRKNLRVAGLGGVFRGRVWFPQDPASDADARFHSADDLLAATPKSARFRDGIPLKHHSTVFPDTFRYLALQKADILVCHEAPSCHPKGFWVIDKLAAQMGAKLIVNGHHHQAYQARLTNGVRVRGFGLAEPWGLSDDEIGGRIGGQFFAPPCSNPSVKAPHDENLRHRKTHVQRHSSATFCARTSRHCGARVYGNLAAS